MKLRMKRYVIALLLLFFVGGMLTAKPAMAASAEVVLSADAEEVAVGDVFFAYLTINSDAMFGDFEASVTYDDEILKYQGGAPKIKGSSGFLTISDMGTTEGGTTRKYTMKFEAAQVGTCKISFSDRAMVYDFETGMEMSVSSNILTINVVAAKTASANAKLKSLKISPSLLTPEFSADTTEYSTEVGYETEQLVIDALPEDEKASVSITGNALLQEGQNKITITVLAESGTVIEYIINANRAKAPEVTATAEDTILPDTTHGSFEIVRINGERYAVYSGQYKLLEPGTDIVAPEGYLKTKLIISDISITAFYPKGDMESDFLLLYAENELEEVGFYRYDRIERTMQRYIPGEETISSDELNAQNEDLITSEQYRTNLTKAAVVIALLGALCALLITLMIRMFIKSKGYKDDDLD